MKIWRAAVGMAMLAGLAGGCASAGEKEAFQDWRTVEASTGMPQTNETPKIVVENKLPKLNDSAGLSDYLAYAALNNAGLEAAFNRWRAALERIPQARTLPDPRFTYAYYIEQVETRVGPQRHKFGLAQTFPWYGKLSLRGDVATQNARVEQQKYEALKLKLFYQVRAAYYEYYYLARSIDVTDENLRLLKALEEVARARYATGAPVHANLIKIQVELGKLEDRIRSLRGLRGPVTARLNAAMNRPVDSALPWPKAVPREEVNLSDEQVYAWVRESNPELKAIDAATEREKKAIALARKRFYPDLTFGLDYIETGKARMAGVPDSGKDPVIAMVSVNLPIWHQKYRAGVREARARYRASLKDRTDRENVLLAEVKMTLYDIRDADRKINLYRDALIPKAEESLNSTQKAFLAAQTSFLDIIDAERILLEFQLSYERAVTDHARGMAKLEMLLGREIQRVEAGPVKKPQAPGGQP